MRYVILRVTYVQPCYGKQRVHVYENSRVGEENAVTKIQSASVHISLPPTNTNFFLVLR